MTSSRDYDVTLTDHHSTRPRFTGIEKFVDANNSYNSADKLLLHVV